MLAAAQGLVYIFGALAASIVARRMGKRTLLILIHAALATLTVAMALFQTPQVFVALLLVWMFLCAINWPAQEALLCHGTSAEEVSRRVGRYNLVWAATGALAIAVIGFIPGYVLFYVASGLHLASAVSVWLSASPTEKPEQAHLHVPAELISQRELARQLSRLALPASYTIIYAITPLLASLPSIMELRPEVQGLVASVWLVARVGAFWVMGITRFWHTRPTVLMGAVVVMAVAFWGVVTPVSPFPVLWIIGSQLLLGAMMGVIYSGSLYFGMVLSHSGEGEGSSTEQGGYHEAMIGLGTVLGPGVGAAAGLLNVSAKAGVGAVVMVSTLVCAAAAWRAGSDKLTSLSTRNGE